MQGIKFTYWNKPSFYTFNLLPLMFWRIFLALIFWLMYSNNLPADAAGGEVKQYLMRVWQKIWKFVSFHVLFIVEIKMIGPPGSFLFFCLKWSDFYDESNSEKPFDESTQNCSDISVYKTSQDYKTLLLGLLIMLSSRFQTSLC